MSKFATKITINNSTISLNDPTYFIADIAANHDNDMERAKDLIYQCAEAGANAWLIVVGKNMYFLFALFFLPMIVVAFHYAKNPNELIPWRSLLMLLFILAIKFLSGYEYTSTIMITTTLPILYFYLRDKWPKKKAFHEFAKISATCLLAFTCSVLIYFIQIKLHNPERNPIEHLSQMIKIRTHPTLENMPKDLAYAYAPNNRIVSVRETVPDPDLIWTPNPGGLYGSNV